MVNGESSDRLKMQMYWKDNCKMQSIEEMMLDSNADALTKLEIPQVLNMLPEYEGKCVLELASGIGRFTQHFSKKAKKVIAVEFMQEFHDKNVKLHEKMSHVELKCADVTNVDVVGNSQDLVFSNWLLMYLGDEEVQKLAGNMLKWIKPNGHLFFRESCFQQSGNAKRNENPTYYRHPSFYVNAFRKVVMEEEDGMIASFELVSSCSVDAYRTEKNNNGQVCYLWKKMITKGTTASFQKFLDAQQYSIKSITRYEKIFGEGYVSTGGQETTTEFVDRLDLKPNQYVLDVGCGIGGGDFYMAQKFKTRVVGIDLSTNMIHVALERSMHQNHIDVAFEVCDATQKQYQEGTFDVVYSRDTILHIEDKLSLFQSFYKWLKPGGKVLISDYCRGDPPSSQQFDQYVASRGYHLLTPNQYGQVLKDAKFINVTAEDRTQQFIGILQDEVKRTKASKTAFIQDTSPEDYDAIVDGWTNKIQRCQDGDQKWGLFIAQKPF